MSISFDEKTSRFFLGTKNSAYVIGIVHGKYPVHLYYGRKRREYPVYQRRLKSFQPYSIEEGGETFSYDATSTECPFFGSGDFRCTALKLKNADGNSVTEFFYDSYSITSGRRELTGLPCAEGECDTLELVMRDDAVTGCVLHLYYTVFEDMDVISRYAVLENRGDSPVVIQKFMSLSVDVPGREWDLITIHGAYAWEHMVSRTHLMYGNQSVFSRRGSSSQNFNPFAALCSRRADEEHGEVYAFNLVYSGNFLTEVEQSQMEESRVQIGLGSENFSWNLGVGESFETPEAIMTYTRHGIGQMSRNLHRFTRECIMPHHAAAARPSVLNSWEACFFDIDEKVLVDFAEKAAESGIDMLVMDDGWFGKRDNDQAGLGDWYANPGRFPDGLRSFVGQVKSKGVKFGIWIEPEMVNPDSDLYRAHPEWALAVPGRKTGLSRSQLVLDMSNPDVVEYLKRSFEATLGDVPFDYIKWDMNRHLSNVASSALGPEQQCEVAHRYVMGVYALLRWFRTRFPDIVIETCSGGGGRYDLGMMKYSDMIWTSDVTNPEWRTVMQYGAQLAYPAAVMSCHVSNPGDNEAEMAYRFGVAVQGMLGYELHILDISDKIRGMIPKQLEEYRQYEDLIRTGGLYRLLNPKNYGDNAAFYYVNDDASRILLSFVQVKGDVEKPASYRLRIAQADAEATYVDRLSGARFTGGELREGVSVSMRRDKFASRWYFVKE